MVLKRLGTADKVYTIINKQGARLGLLGLLCNKTGGWVGEAGLQRLAVQENQREAYRGDIQSREVKKTTTIWGNYKYF